MCIDPDVTKRVHPRDPRVGKRRPPMVAVPLPVRRRWKVPVPVPAKCLAGRHAKTMALQPAMATFWWEKDTVRARCSDEFPRLILPTAV